MVARVVSLPIPRVNSRSLRSPVNVAARTTLATALAAGVGDDVCTTLPGTSIATGPLVQ